MGNHTAAVQAQNQQACMALSTLHCGAVQDTCKVCRHRCCAAYCVSMVTHNVTGMAHTRGCPDPPSLLSLVEYAKASTTNQQSEVDVLIWLRSKLNRSPGLKGLSALLSLHSLHNRSGD